MSRFLPLAFAALVVGCADRDPTAPLLPDLRVTAGSAAARDITVMAQNLYVGADVDVVIRALLTPSPDDDLPALLNAIETLGRTDFPARAEAIADEIARARPHAVGLQEVSDIDIDLTPLGLQIVVNLDFLALLQDALARRNLHYIVAAQVQNVEVAVVGGLVRLADSDALLVDADRVTVTAADGKTFDFNVGPVGPIELKRGWVWARVTIGTEPYMLVSTHAEADLAGASLSGLRALQFGEIVQFVAGDERVIMMGDFNDTPGSPMYQVLQGAGFTYTWAALHPGARGHTCCHVADLSDRVADFSKRIDYVVARGLGVRDGQKLQGQIDRFGEVPSDRVAGPAYLIWPSDHTGLIAALRISSGR